MSKKTKTAAASGKDARIALAAVLDAAHGAELHEALAPLVDATGTVTLEAGEVEKIDTAGLQVLTAFVLARRSQGRDVAWEDVSNEMRRAAELLGMAALLEITA